MEKKPGAVVIIVGGALMTIGAFLTWVTAKVDLTAFADAIKEKTGVDVTGVPGFSSVAKSYSAAGIKGWEGKLALVGGLLALGLGVAAIIGSVSHPLAGRIAAAGGALGILGAGYVLVRTSSAIADAKASMATEVTTLGLSPSIVDTIFKVSTGIGLYLTLLGGVIAIVGAIMLMRTADPVTTAVAPSGAPAGPGSGFGAPTAPMASTPAGASSAPPPAAPSPPAVPPTTQVAPPEPPAPMGGGTGGDDPS
ncbi:MAG: hypothetical protein QOG88_1588 [Actinomycetota bacterium]|jgi:hypothetical protein|nr:hypothetical protein [Actinomycetota bacterium]